MGTNDKAVKTSKKPHILKAADSTPERSFFAPWLRGNKGFFRVHLTIIGPETKQPKSYFPLSRRQAKSTLKAIMQLIEALEEELR